jgi:3-keto-5-aminohexanoate cleavage enzyme
MAGEPLIVNLCPTGMVPRTRDAPALPVTPAAIAEDVARCRDAGASVVHLHARDDDEEPTWRRERFAEIVAAVVERAPDVVVVVTTSGRTWGGVDKRADVLDLDGDLRPEMASLTLGSNNFAAGPSVNAPETIVALAGRMRERGIVPELEAFEPGMLAYARHLVAKGVLRPPFYVNLLLGSPGTAEVSAASLAAFLAALPAGATWSVGGVGRHQLAANVLGIALGGHVRVGMEDSPYLDYAPTRLPATNAELVERVVRIARELGREPATPAEARALIGLPVPDRLAQPV